VLQRKLFLLPRFRGNLFYIVQRYRTSAIAIGGCLKDLHRSVPKRCSSNKVINSEQTGVSCLAILFESMDSP
jgi:hypothetical protein